MLFLKESSDEPELNLCSQPGQLRNSLIDNYLITVFPLTLYVAKLTQAIRKLAQGLSTKKKK